MVKELEIFRYAQRLVFCRKHILPKREQWHDDLLGSVSYGHIAILWMLICWSIAFPRWVSRLNGKRLQHLPSIILRCQLRRCRYTILVANGRANPVASAVWCWMRGISVTTRTTPIEPSTLSCGEGYYFLPPHGRIRATVHHLPLRCVQVLCDLRVQEGEGNGMKMRHCYG